MFLGGRRQDGRGGGDRVIGGVVAAVAAATVATAAVARHVVIAVGPPWRGATGDARLGVRIVIDVGAVRRRWRHSSCTKQNR